MALRHRLVGVRWQLYRRLHAVQYCRDMHGDVGHYWGDGAASHKVARRDERIPNERGDDLCAAEFRKPPVVRSCHQKTSAQTSQHTHIWRSAVISPNTYSQYLLHGQYRHHRQEHTIESTIYQPEPDQCKE